MAVITKTEEEFKPKREIAQKLAFEKIKELLQRNVSKNVSKTYIQYTRDLLRNYVASPIANQDVLRDISRFLCRNSMLYQKLLFYYSSMPLFYYNITKINDFVNLIEPDGALKDYYKVLSTFDKFNLKKEGSTALYVALRDGIYVGYTYKTDNGIFTMPLDSKYVRVYGKNDSGEWIVYFDATFFNAGNNLDFIYGVNKNGIGVWDDVFKEGYEAFHNNGNDYRWFRLPPEKTFCLLSCPDDEFYAPLPFFLPLFDLILSNLDLTALLDSRTELENYILLVSKIPLIKDSDDLDDFALSLQLVQQMQALIDEAVPDLVGTAYSPMDLEKITFERSNTTDDTDKLSESIQNIFNNAGASQLVVAGGSSTNSVGLNMAIRNDISTCWMWIDRIQSWLNYYIRENISKGYELKIHKITWYNQEEYQESMKTAATLGGSALDYLTALGDSPLLAYSKLTFENAIGIKDIMIPLKSSYNTATSDISSDDKGGRPNDDNPDTDPEVSKEKNLGTKANS